MNKAFTKESDGDEPEDNEQPEIPITSGKNYVTPTGFSQLQEDGKENTVQIVGFQPLQKPY
jgi:hypothetical protein